MNRTHIYFTLLSCALLFGPGCTPSPKPESTPPCPAQEPGVAKALEEGKAVVVSAPTPAVNEIKTPLAFDDILKKGKPCVLKVFARWCGPCRYMAPLFEKEANKYCSQVIFAAVDADEKGMEAIIGKYASRGFPTFVFFDKDGKFIKDHPGAYPDDDFAKEMAGFVEKYS